MPDTAHAIANCALKLVVFKFLVPKTFWSWVARTTSMLNAQKLTPSTGFAVSLIDVAVVIADRLGGWRSRLMEEKVGMSGLSTDTNLRRASLNQFCRL